ncbi:protease [Bacillus sp. FJAT-27916]|uniref:FMN-binding negative transcriptional regulator n=1 Tax=Bacillus sp. FJAT-27916 TaxID=1679169 RepID=UPI0006712ADC|nr:FMN-binding negative transcriptional regulator [Bacillus sp. FJAT-27916]KMY45757.1 protease [Bacillus sp. FJAT-27916]
MYVPKMFKVTNQEDIYAFIEANSFATLVTMEKGKPIATHLPMELKKQGEDYYLTGHLAYGNRQWKTFDGEVLAIFQGPDAYISSSWYEHEEVPTWNYQAVHVYGQAVILEREELIEELSRMLKKYEGNRENPVLWETLSPELLEQELKGTVGFKIKISDIHAAYKLSQNRNQRDFQSIMERLRHEGNSKSAEIAKEMEKRVID